MSAAIKSGLSTNRAIQPHWDTKLRPRGRWNKVRTRDQEAAQELALHKALADIDRVTSVFNALLRLAEIDSGVRRSGFRRVDLGGLITEVAKLYGPVAEHRGATFIVSTPDKLVIKGDPHLLAQAVGNLVQTQSRLLRGMGAVSVQLRHHNRKVEIVVAG